MKKKSVKIVAILLAIVAALTFGACTSPLTPVEKSQNENVCYYGCPNSKKVKKLNLLKKQK